MANTRSGLVAAKIVEVDKKKGYEPKDGGITVSCMFNPFEYSVSKTNTYQPDPANKSDVPIYNFKEFKRLKEGLQAYITIEGTEYKGTVEKLGAMTEADMDRVTCDTPGKYCCSDAANSGHSPLGSGWSTPSHIFFVAPLPPEWPSWSAIFAVLYS